VTSHERSSAAFRIALSMRSILPAMLSMDRDELVDLFVWEIVEAISDEVGSLP
jgi:hypothetical protein